MNKIKAVSLLLFFLMVVIAVRSQTGNNAQAASPSPTPKPTPKKPARPTNPAQPAPTAAQSKRLIAIQPLPVFCVNDAVTRKETNIPCELDAFELKTGNGSQIAKALSKGDIEFETVGNDWIAIYCTKTKPEECPALDIIAIKKDISQQALPGKPADLKFSREIEVPRREASRIAPLVAKLNNAGITADAAGDSSIRLTSKTLPSRDDLRSLEDRIRLLGWDREVAPPTQRMFELDAGTVAKCLGSSGCGGDSGNKTQTGTADTTPTSPKKDQTGGGTTDTTQSPPGQNTPSDKPKANNGGTTPNTDQGTSDGGNNTGNTTNSGGKKGGGGAGKKSGGGTGKKKGGGEQKAGIAAMLQPVSLLAGADSTQRGSTSSGGGAQGTRGPTTAGASPTPTPTAIPTPSPKPSPTPKPKPSPKTSPAPKATSTPTPTPPASDKGNNGGSSGPDIKSVADMLVFSNSDGSDKGIWEKHRLMAVLDLPRPEVLMNVWSFQASSGDPQLVKREFEEIRQTVSEHNDALQNAIQYGWDYLSRSMRCPGNTNYTCRENFFDPPFYEYITQRFVDDCPGCGSKSWSESGAIQPQEWRSFIKDQFNICDDGKYCLGYVHAFDPVRPTLTNILLTMIAAKDAGKTGLMTAVCMEGGAPPGDETCFPARTGFQTALAKAKIEEAQHISRAKRDDASGVIAKKLKDEDTSTTDSDKNLDNLTEAEEKKLEASNLRKLTQGEEARLQQSYLLAKKYKDDLKEKNTKETKDVTECIQTGLKAKTPHFDCELEDRVTLNAQFGAGIPETLQLSCFKAQVAESLLSLDEVSTFRADEISVLEHLKSSDLESYADLLERERNTLYSTTRVGLLRAAIADFLFNYKMATQYPHDFVPYDLDQSAQELNAQLNPLIIAFNRDVAAFTEHLDAELSCKFPEARWWTGTNWVRDLFTKQKNTFLNNGEVMVRGISGVESIVNTITQSYFDATKPPSITDLVNSVSDAEGKLPGVLKSNLTANEASVIIGALNSVKPAQAKIGREFDVDITPHTLAGASSAELDVKLTVQESAEPTLYKPDTTKIGDDQTSRVGKHNTTTKVRVDSLKLFEVSSFSAMLQRPKSKIPIVPPLFEVPYFGSFIGLPIPGAKEYHRSTAIVSAVIVPTAFDLAYGIDFTGDRVCEQVPDAAYPDAPKYECHKAMSLNDLHRLPIRNFHKKLVECFAASSSRCGQGAQGIDFKTVPPAD
jgi:hypothetical protein